MANKTFVSNSTLTIADNDAEAFGSSVVGQEIVKIRSGVTGVKLDANFERVELTGALATYKFIVVSGTGLQIQNVSDSAVVATIPNINQSVKIAFADGSATLAQSGSTAFTLNTVALATGTAATPTLTGGNVLTTVDGDKSNFQPSLVTVLTNGTTSFTGSSVEADTLDVGVLTLSVTLTGTTPTAGAILTGGLGGLGLANTLAVKDGANISGGAISYFTNLLFDVTGLDGTNDLTMTAAQHAGFTGVITAAGTGTTSGEKITLTTIATGLSLLPAVDNYTLGNFINSVTQTAVGQAITGVAGADTVTAITGVTSTSDLAAGANVVIVPNGANISGGTFSFTVGTGNSLTYNLDNAATATLNVTQAAGALSANGTQNVTLSNAATSLTLNLAVETFTLANATNSVTQGAVGQIIIGDAGADTVTAITAVTSTSDLKAGTNVVVVPNGANISAGTFSATGGTVGYNVDSAATGTLTPAQQALISSASGTQSLTLSAVTTAAATLNASVETFTLATSAGNSATLGANGQNIVLGGASADTISVAGLTPTGYISGLAAADTLVLTTGADIKGLKTTSGGSAGGATGAALATVSGSVTMTNAQHAALTITTSGTTDQITISDSGSGNVTAAAQIEKYVVNGTSNVTVNAATSVDGDSGNQTVTVGGLTATGTYALGTGTDVIVTTTGANIAGVNTGAATTAETLSFAGTTTLTAAQLTGFTTLTGTSTPLLTLTTAITAAMLDNAAVSNTLTTIKLANVASNALTVHTDTLATGIVGKIDGTALTGTNALTFTGTAETNGLWSVTGGAASDVIIGGSDSDTITGGAGADTITGAVGIDVLDGGAGDDTFVYATFADFSAGATVIDGITDTSGTADAIQFAGAEATNLAFSASGALTRITGVEKITTTPHSGAVSITYIAANASNITTIDLSGDTTTTGTNVISSTGADGITTIIGSAGVDQISLLTAAPATTVTGGLGIDTFTITAPATDITITDLGNAEDTFTTATSGTINATLYASSNAVSYSPASGTVGAGTNLVITAPTGTTTATVNLSAVTNSNLLTLNVTTASGATTLTLPTTAGKISVTGGAAVDTIVAAGTLTVDVNINGGEGTGDILSYAATGNISAATITGVEKLTFAGTNTLTAAQLGGFTTLTGTSTPLLSLTTAITAAMLNNAVVTNASQITLGNFNNAITLVETTNPSTNLLKVDGSAAIGTNALTFDGRLETSGTLSITGGAGDDIIYLGSTASKAVTNAGTNTVYVANTTHTNLAAATVTGGAGVDTLVLSVAGVDLIDTDLTNVTAVEKIQLTGISTIVLDAKAKISAAAMTLIGGTAVTTVDVNFAAGPTSLAIDLATAHGTGLVVAEAAATPATSPLTITADALTTSIDLRAITGAKAQAIIAPSVAATLAIQEPTAGTGTLTLTGGFASSTITVGGGIASAGAHTFDASAVLSKVNYTSAAAVQTITTGGAADTIKAGDGADVLDGGAGDDVFSYATSVEFITTGGSGAVVDTVVGGADTDTISITGAIAIVSGDSMARVATVEKLVAATQSASTLAHSIVVNSDARLSSITTIDLSGDTNATSTGVINLTTVTNAIAATLKGVNGGGANTIIGGAGADVIAGGLGIDKITGAAGADTINAGAGDDILYYLLSADLGSAGGAIVDSIVGGDGTDTLTVGTVGTAFAVVNGDSWARVQGVEKILSVANSAAVSIVLSATAATAGIRTVDLGTAITDTGHKIDISAFSSTQGSTLIGSTAVLTTIIGGAGADTITGGGGADVVTGGAGADKITLAAGADVVKLAAIGDSGTFVVPATNTISTTLFDVITDSAATDIITLATYTNAALGATGDAKVDGSAGALTAATNLSSVVLAANKVQWVSGHYDSTNNTFVGAAAGAGNTDALFIYDANALTATTATEAIVIVGVSTSATYTLAAASTGATITIG